MPDENLCLGCGERPATSSNGTVPLCSECAALAQQNKRGIKYEKDEVAQGSSQSSSS